MDISKYVPILSKNEKRGEVRNRGKAAAVYDAERLKAQNKIWKVASCD